MGIWDFFFGDKAYRQNRRIVPPLNNPAMTDFDEVITVDPDKPLLESQSRPPVIFTNGIQ